MESEELKGPESRTDTLFLEHNAADDYATRQHCDGTSDPIIDEVDVKTEPPESINTPKIIFENTQNHALETDSAISNFRIDSVKSNDNYESESLTLDTEVNVNENQDTIGGTDDTEKLEESMVVIKQEADMTDCFAPEISISYDVPEADKSEVKNGEDLRRSLQEEIVLKVEVEDIFEEDAPPDEKSAIAQIKTELPNANDLGTENQSPIDSMMDTSAGHSKESIGTGNVKRIRLSSQSTPDQMTQLHVYDSDFQLNSITGDMLSLEQEAYGLLKAKNKTKVVTSPFVCSKCPKACRNKQSLLGHMKVHDSIERRALGAQQGILTRKLNLKKKELDITKIGSSKDLSLIPYNCIHKRGPKGESTKGKYKCANCGKQYRILLCLRRHQKECPKSKIEFKNEPVSTRVERKRERKIMVENEPVSTRVERKREKKISVKNEPVSTREERKREKKISVKNEPVSTRVERKREKNIIVENEPVSTTVERKGEKNIIVEKEPILTRVVGKRQKKIIIEKVTIKREARGLRIRKVEKNELKKGNGEYKCECGKTFSRRSRLETCLRSHHPEVESRRYTCSICTKPFREKTELMLHRKRQHVKKKFLCKFCPMDYHTQKELFDHLRVHKKVQMMEYKVITAVVEGNQVLKCFICNKTSAELSELKDHVLVDHKEPYICPLCKDNFPTIVDFATHTKSAHPEVEGQSVLDVLEAFSILAEAWKCEECHVQFDNPDDLVKHQTEQHGPVNKKHHESIDDSSKFQFRCEDCRRTFSTLKQLTTHRDIHHTLKDPTQTDKEEETAPERIPTPPPPRPMCVHCRKICNDETALTSHLRLHSMERKYPCKFCDFRFATLEKRRSHLGIHTGDMKFVCFICEYRCTSENRLNNHKLTPKHLDLKQALLNGPPLEPQAPVAQPEVKKKRYPSERKKSKSSDVPATCDICGEEFPSEETMMKHKDTHPFIVFPNEEQPTRIFFK